MTLEVVEAETLLSQGENHQGEDRVAHGQGTRDSRPSVKAKHLKR